MFKTSQKDLTFLIISFFYKKKNKRVIQYQELIQMTVEHLQEQMILIKIASLFCLDQYKALDLHHS